MRVRFIAITDNIDSNKGPYDMILPVKNIFNSQYAKDISRKIKSAFDTKRRQGQFIGAFCSYGYEKDPQDHNHLIIDEAAAVIVRKIFNMYEQGLGKDAIARKLNDERIPCPSEYKRLIGENYRNGLKCESTKYWTYSTVGRILSNRIYAGDMVQGKYARNSMHGKAHKQDEGAWIVAPGTHDAIISAAQWSRVQQLLEARSKIMDFSTDSPLSGFVKCGECGHGMVRHGKGDKAYYNCGTYDRYGPKVCAKHRINKAELEKVLLDDLNNVILAVENIKALAVPASFARTVQNGELSRLASALERIEKLRKGVYEDFKEGILSKEEYLSYRADYGEKENKLRTQLTIEL